MFLKIQLQDMQDIINKKITDGLNINEYNCQLEKYDNYYSYTNPEFYNNINPNAKYIILNKYSDLETYTTESNLYTLIYLDFRSNKLYYRIYDNLMHDIGCIIINFKMKNSNLNLKLMKWNFFKELDIEKLNNINVLICGTGTLGCNIIRNLISWGIKNISAIDYGNVNLSNISRQNLFTTEHASENISKIKACEKSINLIDDTVNFNGYEYEIPMPGHKYNNINLSILENLIKNNDIIFLLTDSKESRWLPTLYASKYNKCVINCALGFDSFTVIRHGLSSNNLGCYFCYDIINPSDTISNRNLDEQCTVSKNGLSPICAGIGIEIFIKLLHTSYDTEHSNEIPHIIRGSLKDFSIMKQHGFKNKECLCCSKTTLNDIDIKNYILCDFKKNEK